MVPRSASVVWGEAVVIKNAVPIPLAGRANPTDALVARVSAEASNVQFFGRNIRGKFFQAEVLEDVYDALGGTV